MNQIIRVSFIRQVGVRVCLLTVSFIVNDEWDARDINKPTIDLDKLEKKKKIKAKRNVFFP